MASLSSHPLPLGERAGSTDRADPYPEFCVHELFEAQVAKTPDSVALVHDGRKMSYAGLNRQANRLAHHLRGMGVRPDTLVAICVEPGFEMIVGLLAVLKAGGAYVPLDPTYPAERLRHMLADSGAVALLTEAHLAQLFPRTMLDDLPVVDLGVASAWDWKPESNIDAAGIGLNAGHLAYVIYTSGSTGTPKGVMVEHASVTRLFPASDAWFQFGEKDAWTLFHSFAFDFSVWEIWGALLYGGRLIIVPKEVTRSPVDFYKLICRENVTILNQTPSAFRQLPGAQRQSEEVHRLRHVILGGEALELSALAPWYEQNHRRTQLTNGYGITETTVFSTFRPLEESDIARRGVNPIGWRLPDLRIYILDAHREPVPVGVSGELYIGGAGVARGYLNQPELTAQRFLPDPFVADGEARMYKTGDLGRWLTDGSIDFLGRNDFQVKIRGFRIELGEIERRLAEYDGVDEAVVVAREDAADDPRLVAYYTHAAAKGKAEDTPEAELLRAHLAGTLPEYMVPAAYVRLNSLPLSVNGKLDRRALPAPDAGAYAAKRYEAPVGDIEAQLSVIWAEELRLERVGRHDNFFDLGGHSLLAVSLLTRVEREFHMRLPLVTMHRAPSIAQMAHLLSREGSRASIGDRMIRLSEGCEPALFCLPGSGCDVLTLRDFASIIRERAVYGIQMKGISGEAPPLSTIGEMAADCIGLIKTVQPEGPYYLAGYSAGALIGFEAARRLRLQGERIGSLILLDPAVPERRAGWVGYLDAAENIFKRTRYHLARLSRLRMRSWFFYVHDKRVRAAAISGATGEVLGARATLYETTNQATLAYKPSPYAGTGLIVHAKTRPESFENLSIWPKLLRGGANSIAVDGDHFSILKPPSLHSIAEEINTHISGNSRRFTISRGGGPKAGVDGSGGGEGQGA